jgi:hypothetical protein
LSGFFLLINLPHLLELRKFADGWLTPLGYARLWLLVLFFIVICFFFLRAANWRRFRTHLVCVLALAGVVGVVDFRRAMAKEHDVAQWIPLHEEEFDRHLGLLIKTPAIGRERLVFSYAEAFDEDYAVYSMRRDGQVEGSWTPDSPQKFYDPDIAADDQRVLMESIRNGRPEIWLSRGKGQKPEFLLEGENPDWHADGIGFAFLRESKIGFSTVRESGAAVPVWLELAESCHDVALSPVDHRVAICAERANEKEYLLAISAAVPGNADREILLQSREPLERPAWSPDGSAIVFSWNRDGNRDLWMIDLNTRNLSRLTRDPAIDTAPVWDNANRRIIFTSDRGRGLEFSTLFWIPAPEIENPNE